MESKDKCEQIIELFNGRSVPGSKEPLLVKFADGGNKKRTLYKTDQRGSWRDPAEVAAVSTFERSLVYKYTFP